MKKCHHCGKQGHFQGEYPSELAKRIRKCTYCHAEGYEETYCFKKKREEQAKKSSFSSTQQIASLEPEIPLPTQKYYNGLNTKAYIDFSSMCNSIQLKEVNRLNLIFDKNRKCVMKKFDNGRVVSLGTARFRLKIVEVECMVDARCCTKFRTGFTAINWRPF